MQRLKEEADQTIRRIHKNLGQLASSKTLLEENGRLIQGQIESNLARQAEALRQREAWLLKQVDLIRGDKMDTLDRQRESMTKALNDLKTCLANPHAVENQLSDCIERANSISWTALDSPFISFRADSAILREVVSQYGRVSCGYGGGHFADPSRPSACLPQPVEDEDENADWESCYSGQLMAHKKLMTNSSSRGPQHNIRIPRHSTNSGVVKAWLSMQQQSATASYNKSRKFADGSDSFEVISPPSRTSSMHDWLLTNDREEAYCSNICGKADADNLAASTSIDNFTYRDYKLCEIENLDQEMPCLDDRMRNHFERVRDSSSRNWLQLESNNSDMISIGDEKEADHAELIAGVCCQSRENGEACKRFEDCCREENCCSRLLDSRKPAWNKWILDNKVLPTTMATQSRVHHAAMDFTNSEVSQWLASYQTNQPESPGITSPDFKFTHNEPGDVEKWTMHKCKEGMDEEKQEIMEIGSNFETKNDDLTKWLRLVNKEDRHDIKSHYSDWLQKSLNDLALEEEIQKIAPKIREDNWLLKN